MFELQIIMTGKSFSPKSKFSSFADDRKSGFSTMAEAREYLRERYRNCKRTAIYTDTKDGRTIRCGWIYGFRNSDLSHSPIQHWIQQDWVSVIETKIVDLDIAA